MGVHSMLEHNCHIRVPKPIRYLIGKATISTACPGVGETGPRCGSLLAAEVGGHAARPISQGCGQKCVVEGGGYVLRPYEARRLAGDRRAVLRTLVTGLSCNFMILEMLRRVYCDPKGDSVCARVIVH